MVILSRLLGEFQLRVELVYYSIAKNNGDRELLHDFIPQPPR